MAKRKEVFHEIRWYPDYDDDYYDAHPDLPEYHVIRKTKTFFGAWLWLHTQIKRHVHDQYAIAEITKVDMSWKK